MKNLTKTLGYTCFFCGVGMGLAISYLVLGLFGIFGSNINGAKDAILTITLFVICVCPFLVYIVHRDKKKKRGEDN